MKLKEVQINLRNGCDWRSCVGCELEGDRVLKIHWREPWFLTDPDDSVTQIPNKDLLLFLESGDVVTFIEPDVVWYIEDNKEETS